jgi:uncharacterized protein (DUF779 family)
MGAVAARVALTPEAAELLRRLRVTHGPLMFHQSGGCCDGSAPMCYPDGEVIIHLTVDVVPGRGSGFSVEAPEGLRFLIRSRLLSEQELRALEDPPARPAGTPVDPPHAAAIRRSGHGQQ